MKTAPRPPGPGAPGGEGGREGGGVGGSQGARFHPRGHRLRPVPKSSKMPAACGLMIVSRERDSVLLLLLRLAMRGEPISIHRHVSILSLYCVIIMVCVCLFWARYRARYRQHK